jgi:hypothetical protein
VELQQLFQPMVEGDMLHLYCPVSVQDKKSGGVDSIVVYRSEKGGPIIGSQGSAPDILTAGRFSACMPAYSGNFLS